MDRSQSPPLIGLTSPPLGMRLALDATARRLQLAPLDATHQSVDLQVADGQAEGCGCW